MIGTHISCVKSPTNILLQSLEITQCMTELWQTITVYHMYAPVTDRETDFEKLTWPGGSSLRVITKLQTKAQVPLLSLPS